MGIRQLVKSGKLSIAEALNKISPQCKTYGWLLRRSERIRKEKVK